MVKDEPLTIACDESGNDGENVLSGGSPVFVHASVSLSPERAAELIGEVRARTGSRSAELKSKTLLQPKNRDVAEWLLQELASQNQASLHLTHKRFFLVAKLFDSTAEEVAHALGQDMYASGGALAGATLLHYLAPQAYGEDWERLLHAFQLFLRSKSADVARTNLMSLRSCTQRLLADEESMLRDIVGPLYLGISHLASLSALQLGEGIEGRLRTGDPLLSAIGATIHAWADSTGRAIHVVHDEAKELTPSRVEWLKYHLARPELVVPSRQGMGASLLALDLVDSKNDARVQVADLLAGIGRAVAESLIAEQPHPLVPLVAPMVSGLSVWPIPEHMDVNRARETMEAHAASFDRV